LQTVFGLQKSLQDCGLQKCANKKPP